MKKLALGLLFIGLIAFLGVNTACADYADTLDTIFGDKISQYYDYASNGTTLLQMRDANGNITYFSAGRQLESYDASNNLIARYIYQGARLVEEWFGFSENGHNAWYYDNGRRDYAEGWDGSQLMDAVYWQDLIDDDYFSMNETAKEEYLATLLGTVTDDDIDDMREALDALYAQGVTDQNLAFMVAYLPNSGGTGVFAYQVTFYNEQGESVRVIGMQDDTEERADPVVTGEIKYDEATDSYYLEDEEGNIWWLVQGNSGRHDAGNFSAWLGDTENGVGHSLTVKVDGVWVTIDSTEAAAALGYDNLQVMDLRAWCEANVGQTVTLSGDAGSQARGGTVLYVDGVWIGG